MAVDWSRYLGIPYNRKSYKIEKGLFCWSLVRHVIREERGITLPKVPWGGRRDEGLEVELGEGTGAIEIPIGQQRALDVAVMMGVHAADWVPFHVGIWVDGRSILHVENANAPSHIVRADRGDMKWRLQRTYRLP